MSFKEFSKSVYGAHDGVIMLTQAHQRGIEHWDEYHGDNFKHAANGIVSSDFPELREEDEKDRDPHRCMYAASPDRGLGELLELWPQVREQVPDATLNVYYSWTLLKKRNPKAAEVLGEKIKKLKDLGVTLVGGVSHPELHKAYRQSSVVPYSTVFYEIYAISVVKAAASGCFYLSLRYGSLPEVIWKPETYLLPRSGSNGVTETSITTDQGQGRYAEALVRFLKNPPGFEERLAMSKWAKERFSWAVAAKKFDRILRGLA